MSEPGSTWSVRPLRPPRQRDIATLVAERLGLGLGAGVRHQGRDLTFLFRDCRQRLSMVRVSCHGNVIEARVAGRLLPGAAVTEAVRRRLGPLDLEALRALEATPNGLVELPFLRGTVVAICPSPPPAPGAR